VNRGFDELHSGEDLEAWLEDIGMGHRADALFDLNYTLLSDLRAIANSSMAYELGIAVGMRGLELKAFAFDHWQQMVWTPTSYTCDCNGTDSSRPYMGPECQTLMIPGCMDSIAINYNDIANVDDGTCVIIVYEGDENPCGANADCFHTGPGVLTCACVAGYHRGGCNGTNGHLEVCLNSTCDDINECFSETGKLEDYYEEPPCKNGATCVDSFEDPEVPVTTYRCDCELGWTGENCALDIDECAIYVTWRLLIRTPPWPSLRPRVKTTTGLWWRTMICGNVQTTW